MIIFADLLMRHFYDLKKSRQLNSKPNIQSSLVHQVAAANFRRKGKQGHEF